MSDTQKTLTLSITGMSCNNCVQHVTHALEAMTGVSKTNVDLDAAKATVTIDPEMISLDDLAKAIHDAGYEMTD